MEITKIMKDKKQTISTIATTPLSKQAQEIKQYGFVMSFQKKRSINQKIVYLKSPPKAF